jgi:hypothetical protein
MNCHSKVCFNVDNPDPKHLAKLIKIIDDSEGNQIVSELMRNPFDEELIANAIDHIHNNNELIAGKKKDAANKAKRKKSKRKGTSSEKEYQMKKSRKLAGKSLKARGKAGGAGGVVAKARKGLGLY